MAMRKVALLILIFLTGALVWSAYSLHECREERDKLLLDIYTSFETSRWELEHMGGTFEYLLGENVSDDVMRLYLSYYREHARVSGRVFWFLYSNTHEERYYLLAAAMENLEGFLNSAVNKKPGDMRESVRKNLEELKELDGLFKRLNRYQKPDDVPRELAEEFFKASEDLKW